MPDPHMEQAIAEIHSAFLTLIRLLVDDTEAVILTAEEEGDGVVLRLKVADTDVGKVIGKAGRTAQSLRTILRAVSMKYKFRFNLDIEEAGS